MRAEKQITDKSWKSNESKEYEKTNLPNKTGKRQKINNNAHFFIFFVCFLNAGYFFVIKTQRNTETK